MSGNDKEWLNKVRVAYSVYQPQSQEVEEFIKWLYLQYGILFLGFEKQNEKTDP